MAAAALVVAFGPPPGAEGSHRPAVVLLGAAMGIQNAIALRVAVPDLTTTVLTRTIAGAFADAGRLGRLEEKAGRQLLSVATLAGGAAVGALLVLHSSRASAVAAPAALAAAVAVAALRPARSDAPWTRGS
jgi:uncharacterized membrane protein YoaK (UPF0700 family)